MRLEMEIAHWDRLKISVLNLGLLEEEPDHFMPDVHSPALDHPDVHSPALDIPGEWQQHNVEWQDDGAARVYGKGGLQDLIPNFDSEKILSNNATQVGTGVRGTFNSSNFSLIETSALPTQHLPNESISKLATGKNRFQEKNLPKYHSLIWYKGYAGRRPPSSLTREEAVKLFYQICVTHSNSFVKASQTQAYGDILLQAGRFM
eukprot:gene13556-19427_t